jgi:hypothetical protein
MGNLAGEGKPWKIATGWPEEVLQGQKAGDMQRKWQLETGVGARMELIRAVERGLVGLCGGGRRSSIASA